MKTQSIITLAVGAPILIAIFWNILSQFMQPKRVPVRVRKSPRK